MKYCNIDKWDWGSEIVEMKAYLAHKMLRRGLLSFPEKQRCSSCGTSGISVKPSVTKNIMGYFAELRQEPQCYAKMI